MASFQYRLTITYTDGATTSKIEEGALDAVGYARRLHYLPDGTRIAIHRRRLVQDKHDPPRKVPTGPELVYRRYEVNGGIVRRVDR